MAVTVYLTKAVYDWKCHGLMGFDHTCHPWSYPIPSLGEQKYPAYWVLEPELAVWLESYDLTPAQISVGWSQTGGSVEITLPEDLAMLFKLTWGGKSGLD